MENVLIIKFMNIKILECVYREDFNGLNNLFSQKLASPDTPINDFGMSALHLICSLIQESSKNAELLIKACIENGANPNIQDMVPSAHGCNQRQHRLSPHYPLVSQAGSLALEPESTDNRRRNSATKSSHVLQGRVTSVALSGWGKSQYTKCRRRHGIHACRKNVELVDY
ncbi:hypothetical protein FGO68_gene10069 [Halteria grandinella]|uniref:Uncharacterized protein n=1 Tax=Halteria grandinella TaxID=5974 RepID=A0A8J8NC03_HALGN|nr:hypothetical protein FGO68_gene10069 [Halteria grandinella]